jgi:hypothetical protein
MEMKITEEQCKLLTEWLGECWHDKDSGWIGDGVHPMSYEVFHCYKCKKEGRWEGDLNQRTFDNWTDFGVVVEKIRRSEAIYFNLTTFEIAYLFDKGNIPEHFCILVAEAIKEGALK